MTSHNLTDDELIPGFDVGPPVERIEKVVEREIHFRCPKCLGHLKEETACHPGQKGMVWDCPRCNIRCRIWQYFPGGKTVIP